METKFCRAELKATRSKKPEYDIFKNDIITHSFIVDIVTMNGIQSFYEKIMDMKKITGRQT